MTTTSIRLFAILVVLPLAACASQTGSGPEPIPLAIANPPTGSGQVVFFRPGNFIGALVRCTVRENGKLIVRISAGRYFVAPMQPGTHVFTAATEATDILTVQVPANGTAYVKCSIRMGVLVGRPNLSASNAAEFARASPQLKPQTAKKVGDEPRAD